MNSANGWKNKLTRDTWVWLTNTPSIYQRLIEAVADTRVDDAVRGSVVRFFVEEELYDAIKTIANDHLVEAFVQRGLDEVDWLAIAETLELPDLPEKEGAVYAASNRPALT